MGRFLKDYFAFTRSELRIILILSILLLVVLLFRLFTSSNSTPQYKPSADELRLVEEFIESLEFENDESAQKEKMKPGPLTREFYTQLKVFDPNKVLINELKEMGFPENVISNISKYRKSGGYFIKPEEFKKIYGITDYAYKTIAPYLSINDSERKGKILHKINTLMSKDEKILNLNRADSSDLVALNGIGPGFALRIIKYRERLGGFIVSEQLLEVFGMDSTRFALFKEEIYADTADIRKIDLNNVSFSELSKHPYIDSKLQLRLLNSGILKAESKISGTYLHLR